MVTIEEFRKSLGTKGQNLSEKEVEKLSNITERISDALFNSWLKSAKQVNSIKQ